MNQAKTETYVGLFTRGIMERTNKKVELDRGDPLFLRESEKNILKSVLRKEGPMRKWDLEKGGVPRSTVMKRVDPLVARGNLQVVVEDIFERTGKPSRHYDVPAQGLLALSLADPEHVLLRVDLRKFFLRRDLGGFDLDAIRGMLKVWISYARRSPRIDRKIPYVRGPSARAEFLSNVNRAILDAALRRTSPLSGCGSTPWLVSPSLTTPDSLEEALKTEGGLYRKEAKAVLNVLYKEGVHFSNTEMALLAEALWEARFAKSREKVFWLGGCFSKDGSLLRVGARLSPNILEDFSISQNSNPDPSKSFEEVVIERVEMDYPRKKQLS